MCARLCLCAEQKIRSRVITERSGPAEITQREKQKKINRKIQRDTTRNNIKNNKETGNDTQRNKGSERKKAANMCRDPGTDRGP